VCNTALKTAYEEVKAKCEDECVRLKNVVVELGQCEDAILKLGVWLKDAETVCAGVLNSSDLPLDTLETVTRKHQVA
jgi:hypothetical protein